MNDFPDDLAAQIDRLVDGELDADGRRGLLIRLDREPCGWRRCALAFLEAQAWRESLGPAVAPAEVPIPARASSRRGHATLITRAGLIAAGLLAAFLIGRSTGAMSRPGSPEPRVAHRPEAAPVPRPRPVETVGAIEIPGTSGDGAGGTSIPILAGPGLDERWLRARPRAIPDYVRAQWERRGYQVEQHRELLSVDLEDGRRLAVPVDQVEFQYVGSRPY